MVESPETEETSVSPPANLLLRGLCILEAVAQLSNRRGVGVKEISEETGLDKSTTSRILALLRDAGYVRQDTYRRYRLTSKLSQMTAGYSDLEDLLIVVRPHLESMHAEFDEEVHLAVLDGGYMQFVDYIPSSQVVRSNLSTTERLVHDTAAGRAALAHLSNDERAAALRQSAEGGGTAFSDDEIAALQRELDEARDRGWAGYDSGDGVARFAAPIFDASGNPVAAMCISGPAYRVAPRSDAFSNAVMDAASKASRALQGL